MIEQAEERAQGLLDVIKRRRSIRRFKDKPVREEEIDFLLEAARWAPTSFECRRFAIVNEEPVLSTVIDLAPGIRGRPRLVIVVCADRDVIQSKQIYPELACQEAALATQNILLAASSLGLGACFIGSFSRRGIATVLNLPKCLQIHNLVAVGHPAEEPPAVPRNPIEAILVRKDEL
jgi:nitroreductase